MYFDTHAVHLKNAALETLDQDKLSKRLLLISLFAKTTALQTIN